MNQTNDRTWLIRHTDYTFSRPLSEVELLELFAAGEMKPQDEICPATGYWFSLQDVKEMRKHFGTIPMDGLFKKINEEVTKERYAVTSPIAVPLKKMPTPTVSSTPRFTSKLEEPVQQTSPMMKLVLFTLTILVLILLFVWFG